MTVFKTILVAPLNWGIGHATRCIPIIRQLLAEKHRVILASDGAALNVLKGTFPQLPFEELPSYHITYPEKGNFTLHMVKSAPSILQSIEKEHQRLPSLIEKWGIDTVISDHRYGMYHADVTSILIAHQIRISLPFGENVLAHVHQKFLAKFDAIWVPDAAGGVNLSGKLSHDVTFPKKHAYLGILSRFSAPLAKEIPDGIPTDTPFILVLISGPEPQRSALEKTLIQELQKSDKLAILVGGNPLSTSAESVKNGVHYPFLSAPQLKWVITHASAVICRSGYSTIMDLVALSTPAVLVPTPGQTEQEYLAKYLSTFTMFCTLSQTNFTLPHAIQLAQTLTKDPKLLSPIQATSQKTTEISNLLNL